MKKTLLFVLMLTVIVQIFVPVYTIWEKYDVLRNGEEVKIKINPIDPYDAFRGRYVSLWYNYDMIHGERNGRYGILEVGEDGFAYVCRIESAKPEDELYLTSENENSFHIPLDRYYMEETLAPKAEKFLSGDKEAYVTVRIKGDKSVLSGLYIDGKPAEELLETLDE